MTQCGCDGIPGAGCGAPDFPPLFEVEEASGDAFTRAVEAAAAGAGAGTLVWARPDGALDVAVVFEPDRPLVHAWPAVLVAMLAAADALAAAAPPQKPIGFAWPDRILVDGGEVGRVRAAAPPGAVPAETADWLVVGLTLRLRHDGTLEPGHDPGRTSLAEEGFDTVDPALLAGAFARHLLHWVSGWQTAGLAEAAEHWLAHLPQAGPEGPGHGLDPATGDLLVLRPGALAPERHNLADALARGADTLARGA
ncbi:MAG TPA: biotin/lipoate--protein ligase family protein [Azospirillaceae bacterium]|nr:biotin/lipoate--protein ligase family protein [Azospirillaceae bacterium]